MASWPTGCFTIYLFSSSLYYDTYAVLMRESDLPHTEEKIFANQVLFVRLAKRRSLGAVGFGIRRIGDLQNGGCPGLEIYGGAQPGFKS